MFFGTRLCPEIRAAIQKGENNLTINASLEAEVETGLHYTLMQNKTSHPVLF
jgi:hypothetical protein